MFNPKYLISLSSEVFAGSEYVCLGWQLLELLNFIKNLLPPQIWYGADIETNDQMTWKLEMNSFELKKIGNFSAMKKIAQETDQFESGVFIAIRDDIKIDEGSIEVGTEDHEFEARDIEGVLVEIRAFDTSYFEIYSDDYELMRKISEKYNIEIKKKPLDVV